MRTILTILGTRPEAIKLAPVLLELEKRKETFHSIVCATGQHREMLDSMLRFFSIHPEYNLEVMRESQSLSGLTARLLEKLQSVLEEVQPDWVLVQGDTTTVMTAGLAAYYGKISIGHVEAGLRTNNKYSPYPEEINRRLVGVLADAHFAPTMQAVENLVNEGIPESQICLSGNTVVDALKIADTLNKQDRSSLSDKLLRLCEQKRVILVTGHRRENFGTRMEHICHALCGIADSLTDCVIIYPVHFNPQVQEPVNRILGNQSRIHLIEPVEYPVMVELLSRAWLVLTDSGGIQEEAPTFGVPCLVMRDNTERPEGISKGVSKLVGTDRQNIIDAVMELARTPNVYKIMASGGNPYGDGQAAVRIVDWLEKH